MVVDTEKGFNISTMSLPTVGWRLQK